jgi:hypothetical protein
MKNVTQDVPNQTDEKGRPMTYWGGLSEHNQNYQNCEEQKEYEDRFVNIYENANGNLVCGAVYETKEQATKIIENTTSRISGSKYIKTINLKDLI